MKMGLGRRVACAASILWLAAANAEVGAPGANSAESPGEVFVTATRVPQPVDMALEPIIVIDRSELENSLALDIGNVLQFKPGLDIARTGGPGQPLSLFIRGANSDQSIVMIDGVRINSGTVGLAPLQNLAPDLFERIEIVEGPRSTIYGTDAIGGVVNLITRTGGYSGLDAQLSYGRYDTASALVDGVYSGAAGSAEAIVEGQRSSGFPPFTGDTQAAAYRNLSGLASASTKLGRFDLGAFYWWSDATTDYANPVYNDDFSAFTGFTPASEHFFNSALAAHAGAEMTDVWHVLLTLSHIVIDLRQQQVPDYDLTERDWADLQNDVTLPGRVSQHITFGAILTNEHTDSLSFGTFYGVGFHTQTYYAQDQLEFGASRLLLAAGEYHHPAFGNHATWNLEYGYSLTPDLLLIGSAGTAFRAPSSTDRFGFGGNPDLLPESSRNFELGVKARIAAAQELTFAAFQDTITDLIEFVPNPENLVYGGENENVDRARIRGLEAAWTLTTDEWSLSASASLQDPRDLTTEAHLLRRTRQSFAVRGARNFGPSSIGIELLQAGPRPDLDVVTGAPVTDGGYLLASAYAKLVISSAWSITGRLDNALDRHYQLANGYNTAGRSASISVKYQLR